MIVSDTEANQSQVKKFFFFFFFFSENQGQRYQLHLLKTLGQNRAQKPPIEVDCFLIVL